MDPCPGGLLPREAAESSEGFDPVRIDQTRLVYEQAPFGLIATVTNAVLLALVESPFVPAGVA